jgi:hypothetical protein
VERRRSRRRASSWRFLSVVGTGRFAILNTEDLIRRRLRSCGGSGVQGQHDSRNVESCRLW